MGIKLNNQILNFYCETIGYNLSNILTSELTIYRLLDMSKLSLTRYQLLQDRIAENTNRIQDIVYIFNRKQEELT